MCHLVHAVRDVRCFWVKIPDAALSGAGSCAGEHVPQVYEKCLAGCSARWSLPMSNCHFVQRGELVPLDRLALKPLGVVGLLLVVSVSTCAQIE